MTNENGQNQISKQSPAVAVYRKIERDMREKVRSGQWRPGMLIPSRKALSREYGVDIRTVQRAVGLLLDDGLLSAENGRGTFVNNDAETDQTGADWLRSQKVRTIGLVVDHIVSPSEQGPHSITKAIHGAVYSSSGLFRLISFDMYDEQLEDAAKHESDALSLLENGSLVGAIIWHCGSPTTLPQMRRVVEQQIPMVLIDRLPSGLNCDFVGIDNAYTAREATEYLISLGHKRIAFLAPDENISTLNERVEGYRTTLRKASLPLCEELEFRPPLAESIEIDRLKAQLERAAAQIRKMSDPPTAIFAANDVLARQMIMALEKNEMSVPEDISVIGLDDLDRFSSQPPFLTSMRQPFDLVGERAAQLLLERIEARSKPSDFPLAYKQILLPTKLIVRNSCRSIRPEDENG